jgi:hypothetical protein
MAKKETVEIEILRDGVFVADNDRQDVGAVVSVPAEIADALQKSGHAKVAGKMTVIFEKIIKA